MHFGSNDIVRLFVLAIFCVSAMSPLCVSGHLNDNTLIAKQHNDERTNVTIGIVWVKILLFALTGRMIEDNCGDGIPDGTTVLTKKNGAVCREYANIRPYQEAKLIPLVKSQTDLVRSLKLEHLSYYNPHIVKGYRHISTGLSPPPQSS